jgi:FeS assembly SUF system protein
MDETTNMTSPQPVASAKSVPAAEASNAPEIPAAPPRSLDEIEAEVIEVLRSCYDPEIPVNIYDLGLIYDIKLDDAHNLAIRMTLTSPMCPVAGSLPPEVQRKTAEVGGVVSSRVDLVWDPPWTQDMMGEAAKIKLGFDL